MEIVKFKNGGYGVRRRSLSANDKGVIVDVFEFAPHGANHMAYKLRFGNKHRDCVMDRCEAVKLMEELESDDEFYADMGEHVEDKYL